MARVAVTIATTMVMARTAGVERLGGTPVVTACRTEDTVRLTVADFGIQLAGVRA